MSESIFEKDKYVFSSYNKIRVVKKENTISKQTILYTRELKLYKVGLNSLINRSPKDSMKNLSLNLAYYLVQNEELLEKFKKKRELPYALLSKETKVNRMLLESLSDYIIAYTLIMINPNFKDIKEYLNIEFKENSNVVPLDIINREEKDIHRGIVLTNNKSCSIVLNSTGDFIKLKRTNNEVNVGDELAGREKKGFKHYKKSVFIIISIIVLMLGIFIYQYEAIKTTVKIQTTSGISLDVNSFNKVVKASSETKRGKLLVSSIRSENKNIDEGIIAVLEYARENNMFLDNGNGMNIIITGKPLSEAVLEKAEAFIRYEELKININNCGEARKIKPLTLEEKQQKKEKEKIITDKKKAEQEKNDKIKTIEEQNKGKN